MGIFDFLFGKKNKQNEALEQKNTQHSYTNMMTPFSNVVDGMRFLATHQLSTPLDVLKKHGEVYKGDGTPPVYGMPNHGIWLPNPKHNIEKEQTVASDAGPVKSEAYLEYAIPLLEIFNSDLPIHKKMELAEKHSEGNQERKEIENGLLHCYRVSSITDVMAHRLTESEKLQYYFNMRGKLTLVNGVSSKIEKELEKQGVHTLKELAQLTERQLLDIKGIGPDRAKKILIYFQTYL